MSGQKVVVTTFKNEAPYILEWVAFYKVLGFDHIVVFTNDCTDGTNNMLKRLEELGQVTFRINRVGPGGIHRSALRQANRLSVVKNADWLFVCDIDEFLNIHVGNHKIDDLIEATGSDVDAISIPWRLFSNSGRNVLRNELVIRQFTDAELPPVSGGATRRFVKTIFRPSNKFRRIGLHGPVLKQEFENDLVWSVPGGVRKSRQPMGGHVQPPFGYEFAQLNHYAVRSVESYLLKRHRGRANHMSDILDTGYWDRWNRGGEEDLSILRYLPELEEKLDEYRSDAHLARYHRKGFRWHKQKVGELKEMADYAKLKSKCEKRKTLVVPPKERPAIPARPATPLAECEAQTADAALPHIGSLWIGKTLSYVEQMCLLSFVRQGHPVTLFSYGPVDNVPGDVMVADAREIHDPASFFYSKFGTPVVQSDIFRLNLLHQTDMVWADADMFCLRPVLEDQGHVHGYFTSSSVCNALLRLPPESPALKAYLEYVSDHYPIPPWWNEEQRGEAEALKKKGKWKHATEQAHDVYGPPALTWFLNASGEIGHTSAKDVFYPVAFKELDLLLMNSGVEKTHFTENTRAVHLWARRLRWRLPQIGMEEGGFVHSALKDLEINPGVAPLEKEQKKDIWSPARLLPRTATVDEIVETCEVSLSEKDVRGLSAEPMDCAIRLAEDFLRKASADNLYGINDKRRRGRMRGIDHHGTNGQGAYRIANSILTYVREFRALPNLISPTLVPERLIVWKHFGQIQMPSPADRLTVHGFLPKSVRKLVVVPDRPWIAETPDLPGNGKVPEGDYLLKSSHGLDSVPVRFPLSDTQRKALTGLVDSGLTNAHGFWEGEWWNIYSPRRYFLERHVSGDSSGAAPTLWTFWTVNGKTVLVERGTQGSGAQDRPAFDRDLGAVSSKPEPAEGGKPGPRPGRYGDMLRIAESAGGKLDIARVDIVEVSDDLVLDGVAICPDPQSVKRLSGAATRILANAMAEAALFRFAVEA